MYNATKDKTHKEALYKTWRRYLKNSTPDFERFFLKNKNTNITFAPQQISKCYSFGANAMGTRRYFWCSELQQPEEIRLNKGSNLEEYIFARGRHPWAMFLIVIDYTGRQCCLSVYRYRRDFR